MITAAVTRGVKGIPSNFIFVSLFVSNKIMIHNMYIHFVEREQFRRDLFAEGSIGILPRGKTNERQ